VGKRHRKQREGNVQSTRARLEQLLAKGDARGAVDAAKQLVREAPGGTSEDLAVRAYAARIRELIAEGLGREAAALASIVRERFPAHVPSQASLLEDARLAGGDFHGILTELRDAAEERRAAIEERLTPWIVDPAAIARTSLDAADPLAREARIVAELFDIVTARLASPEELAPLGEIRRRSPFASWKLLIRAIDAFHRNEDERVAANVAAIDARSPAARAAEVLTELAGNVQKPGRRSFAAERLIDRISGGRATIAARIRSIETASDDDDRRRLREELRELAKTLDGLGPYAREQILIALLPLCGIHFNPEQLASMLRIDEDSMPRLAVLLAELVGHPLAASTWIEYADYSVERREIEPWQAAEIFLHALALGNVHEECTCGEFHDDEDMPDTGQILEKIIATRPAPAVLARIAPYLDRLEGREERRILTAWRKADPEAVEPIVRLLRLAEADRRYEEVPALLREGDKLKIIDPEYARLRLRLSFRRAEQLLLARKRETAAAFLEGIAPQAEDLGDDAAIYLLALQWAAAPPAAAGELLTRLAARGLAAEIVLAEVTGKLEIPFPLTAASSSASELLEGFLRANAVFTAAGRPPQNIGWIVERAAAHIDEASEDQLIAIADVASNHHMVDKAWEATARGLEMRGPRLARFLLFRVTSLAIVHADIRRISAAMDAARIVARRLNDRDAAARAESVPALSALLRGSRPLTETEVERLIDAEQNSPAPHRAKPRAPKKSRQRKSKPKPQQERDLFEP
jgi:hypothetical protein